MNQYTELLYYIQSLGEADTYVNTITQGTQDEIDWNKSNIFPMLHVFIAGGSFSNGKTVNMSIELTCLNIRETNKEINTDKYFGNDNGVDNMNETLAVLNRIWTRMYKDFDDNNITSSENPPWIPVDKDTMTNQAEGHKLSFDVELPNTTLNLCL